MFPILSGLGAGASVGALVSGLNRTGSRNTSTAIPSRRDSISYGSNSLSDDIDNGYISEENDLGDGLTSGNSYNIVEYLSGLLSSTGAENALNREYNSAEATAARQFSASEAQKNRDWQEYMSNTSYSRSVQDLKNAGLNPILALSNGMSGASTPSGSSAQTSQAYYQTGGGDSASDVGKFFTDLINAMGNSADAVASLIGAIKTGIKANVNTSGKK